MTRKILFFVLILSANIVYGVLPPVPPPALPVPDRYTQTGILNNVFNYPDTLRVSVSTPIPVTITPPITITGSSITVTNSSITQYDKVVSSGVCGKITGLTTASISVTRKVVSWSFKVMNTSDPGAQAIITDSLTGQPMYLFDGDSDSVDSIVTPKAVNFNISLPVSSTVQYRIMTMQ